MKEFSLTPGGIATLACMLEVTAPKPGNVHRGADFEDVTFADFSTSAIVFGQVIDQSRDCSAGQTILNSVLATKSAVGTNTNLGIILLLVPLAKIVHSNSEISFTQKNLAEFLSSLNSVDSPEDSKLVFEAIRYAQPGGLGESGEMDVNATEVPDLLTAMKLAENRDSIARQYATGFYDVFESGVPLLMQGIRLFGNLNQAIVFAHVGLMSRQPDTLIARKNGANIAELSQRMATKAIDALPMDAGRLLTEEEATIYWSRVSELDFWLRSDGHRRNPGTTADLIAATLFVAIQNRNIQPPFQ